MKTDFLKSLGIEDKETINAIMAENGKDIANAQGDVSGMKDQIKTLEKQLSDKTAEFDTLKESTKDYDDLSENNQKLEAEKAQLIADKKQLEVERDAKVSEILKTHAIENSVRDAKAKNVKAVMSLLDMEKITYKDNELSGISEQLDSLKSGEDTGFLFGESNGGAPAGTTFNNPPSGGKGGTPPTATSFGGAIAKALGAK